MDLEKGIKLVNVDDIIPNRFQPRLAFNENELNELAESIKQHGVIQPLVLRQIGDKYEIIAGERRYKASCLAGLREVPAVIMNVDDDKSAEIAVVENIQRKDLTAVEEAQSYKKLLDKGLTQEELATKLGVAQPTIANKIRLLALDEEVQQALLSNKISERHARSMLQLADKNMQIQILHKVMEERLTVKQTDELINKTLGKSPAPKEVAPKEDIFNLNVDNIKNEAENLFETEPVKSFDDLMKKQDEIPVSTPVVENTPQENYEFIPRVEPPRPIEPFNEAPKEETTVIIDTPEILDFDADIKEPLIIPEIEPVKQETIPTNQIIEEFRSQKEEEPPIETIEPEGNSLSDAIKSTRDLKSALAAKGFRVNTEEFDFEDMYQIVIKIQKD